MLYRALYIIAAIAFTLAGFLAYQDRTLTVVQTTPISLSIEPVSFSGLKSNPESQSKLLWRGGIKIASSHKRFGGLSGMEISADGRSLLTVADKGLWFKGRLSYDSNGNLLSLSNGVLSSLNGTTGQSLTQKRDRDSESIALAEDGAVYVSFERDHRILRYPGPLVQTASEVPFPDNFNNPSNNKGIEALTWVPGGCLLAIPERITETETSAQNTSKNQLLIEAFIWDQFSWQNLYLKANEDYLPTGLSVTPYGDLLLLERSFSFLRGFKSSLRLFPAEEIKAGHVMKGEIIATFEGAQAIDNMEGISSRLGPEGETLIYLLSDDNFSIAQDTLLLMFQLQKQRKPAGQSTAGCSKNKTAYSAALETKAF